MVQVHPQLVARGITAVLQKDNDIRVDETGSFMLIPETLADKIIAQEPVDILLNHNKRFVLGRTRKFWKDRRRVGPKEEDVLLAEYVISNQNFIAALREATERYGDDMEKNYYSPDGFIPSRPTVGNLDQDKVTHTRHLYNAIPGCHSRIIAT
jgi:hypothetical protein